MRVDWQLWFRSYNPHSGIWIEIHTTRPMRVEDVERIERYCTIWREIAAEEEGAIIGSGGGIDPAPEGGGGL